MKKLSSTRVLRLDHRYTVMLLVTTAVNGAPHHTSLRIASWT